MLKQKIFNKQLNQWVDTDVGDGIDAYVLPATTPENAGKTLIFDEKGNAIPVDPQGGSGLPEVEGSGKALVSINGEWKEQSGYGYTIPGNQTTIEWDGNTEGREVFQEDYYKVAEELDLTKLEGAKAGFTLQGVTAEFSFSEVNELIDGAYVIRYQTPEEIVTWVVVNDIEIEGVTFTKGVYFVSVGDIYQSSLTYGIPDEIHKIDPKYIGEGQYGYTIPGTQTTIEWDGDTEGRETHVDGYLVKVSDDDAPNENIVGSIITKSTGVTVEITQETYDYLVAGGQITTNFAYISDCVIIHYDDAIFMGETYSKGIYFAKESENDYVSSLTLVIPDEIHKIDSKYIPQSGLDLFVINFTSSMSGFTADKTFDEIDEAIEQGKVLVATMTGSTSMAIFDGNGQFAFQRFNLADGTVNIMAILEDESTEERSWTIEQKTYTLTPAE